MNRLGIPSQNTFRKFEVDASQCGLQIGDIVVPETVVGRDYRTEKPVPAGIFGQVATIYFNPAHHSLMIMIYSLEH